MRSMPLLLCALLLAIPATEAAPPVSSLRLDVHDAPAGANDEGCVRVDPPELPEACKGLELRH